MKMNNILEFKANKQYGIGEAFCIACKHEWAVEVETGTVQIECPNCKAFKGRLKFEYKPAVGQFLRECGCGNQLFYLTPDGHMCANCGTYQSY